MAKKYYLVPFANIFKSIFTESGCIDRNTPKVPIVNTLNKEEQPVLAGLPLKYQKIIIVEGYKDSAQLLRRRIFSKIPDCFGYEFISEFGFCPMTVDSNGNQVLTNDVFGDYIDFISVVLDSESVSAAEVMQFLNGLRQDLFMKKYLDIIPILFKENGKVANVTNGKAIELRLGKIVLK